MTERPADLDAELDLILAEPEMGAGELFDDEDEPPDWLDEADELREKFERWDARIEAHWGAWTTEATLCFGMVAGSEQWDSDALEDMQEAQRVPVTFNRTEPVVDAVSGAEITNRQEVAYLPRDVGDTEPNELISKGAEWIRDRCSAAEEESGAFRDSLICGMGWTETRVAHDVEADGQILIEKVDPLEMRVDPSSRKDNCGDARYLRRERFMAEDEFEDLFPNAEGASRGREDDDGGTAHRVVERSRYTSASASDEPREGEVSVKEYQWWELETVWRIVHPLTGEELEYGDAEYKDLKADGTLAELRAQARANGRKLRRPLKQRLRRYRRAFVSDDRILDVEDIRAEGFTFKAITGKRDRNKGMWYGLVRALIDPQRFSNKFLSQILHILNSGAKGGLMIEEGVLNPEQKAHLENTWASSDENTYLPKGSLSDGKIQPKPQAVYPAGVERMLTLSISAFQDTTGVNEEMLGATGRDQAGVLEHQRKQAAYGILSGFFANARRYRVEHGKLLLRFMQLYIPPGTLLRVIGKGGTMQYVEWAMSDETSRFDVIVDQAPDGPNEKARVFGFLTSLMPLLKDADLPGEVWAEFAEYSPLPGRIASILSKAFRERDKAPPEEASPEQQLARERVVAEIQDKTAGAQERSASAVLKQAQAGEHAAVAEQTRAGTAMGMGQ